jgi:hypothetical protein
MRNRLAVVRFLAGGCIRWSFCISLRERERPELVLHLFQRAVHERQPHDRAGGIISLLSEALDFLLLSLDARFHLPKMLIGRTEIGSHINVPLSYIPALWMRRHECQMNSGKKIYPMAF